MLARNRTIGTGAGFAHGFDGLGRVEQRCGANLGDFAIREEGDGDVGGRGAFRKFRDGKDVIRVERKKSSVNFAAERFDGGTDQFKAISRILHNAAPGRAGVADLMTKVGHRELFLGEGK